MDYMETFFVMYSYFSVSVYVFGARFSGVFPDTLKTPKHLLKPDVDLFNTPTRIRALFSLQIWKLNKNFYLCGRVIGHYTII